MKTHDSTSRARAVLAALVLAGGAWPALAQIPVDEDGNVIGDYGTGGGEAAAIGDDGLPLKSADDLESLVGPIALYPDDLLAAVLPAATYPLQVVEAARFLEALESDPALAPDDDWDDSIVALVNYPEVVELMNQDLDWTWQLGEAVVAQQADVIAAIAAFRDKAAAAGNLNSDTHQSVTRNEDDIIEIEPSSEDSHLRSVLRTRTCRGLPDRAGLLLLPARLSTILLSLSRPLLLRLGLFLGCDHRFLDRLECALPECLPSVLLRTSVLRLQLREHWWYRSPSVVAYNNDYYDQRQVDNRYYEGDRWRPTATRGCTPMTSASRATVTVQTPRPPADRAGRAARLRTDRIRSRASSVGTYGSYASAIWERRDPEHTPGAGSERRRPRAQRRRTAVPRARDRYVAATEPSRHERPRVA